MSSNSGQLGFDEDLDSLDPTGSPKQAPQEEGLITDLNEDILSFTQNQVSESPVVLPVEKPVKPLTKKAKQAAQNLATREGAPLPALNADEVRRKKPIENALKKSDTDRFVFFEKQIAMKNTKDQERSDQLANQAGLALNWEREKFELEFERSIQREERIQQQAERAREHESDRALLLAQNQTASDERRERREVIKECQKNKMSIGEIKEYLSLMFPETE